MCFFTRLIKGAGNIFRTLKLRAYSKWNNVPKNSCLNSNLLRQRYFRQAAGSFKAGTEEVARGIAIGLFIGLTPTFGFQTALMITACILLTGNFPVAFAVSFVSNPFTVAPLYWGFHELGEALLAALPIFSIHDNGGILWEAVDEIVFTGTGSLMIAVPVSVGAYFFSRLVLTIISFDRKRRRKLYQNEPLGSDTKLGTTGSTANSDISTV